MGTGEDEDQRAVIARMAATIEAMSRTLSVLTTSGVAAPAAPSITVVQVAVRYGRRTSRHAMYNLAHVIKHFGERPVASLKKADWLEYRELRQGATTKYDRPPKNSTLNIELSQTLAMMRWALDNELIASNPFERVKKLKARRARETEINPMELDAALADAPVLVRVFQIASNETGMRNGSETRRMEWSHIDWGRSVISIPAENTKTKRARQVPMTEYLKAELRAFPRVVGSRFVFANPETKDPYSRGYLHSLSRRYLNRLTPAPGDERVVTHDGRHGLVSRLGRLGLGVFKSMKVVGHESAAMHFRYDHLSEEDRTNAKNLLDADRKAPHRSDVSDESPVYEPEKVKAGQALTERVSVSYTSVTPITQKT